MYLECANVHEHLCWNLKVVTVVEMLQTVHQRSFQKTFGEIDYRWRFDSYTFPSFCKKKQKRRIDVQKKVFKNSHINKFQIEIKMSPYTISYVGRA